MEKKYFWGSENESVDFAKLCFVRVSELSKLWNSACGIGAKIQNMLVRMHGFNAMLQFMWVMQDAVLSTELET